MEGHAPLSHPARQTHSNSPLRFHLANSRVHRPASGRDCHRFTTGARALFAVEQWIEITYDLRRMHSTIGYRTPAQALTNYQAAALTA